MIMKRITIGAAAIVAFLSNASNTNGKTTCEGELPQSLECINKIARIPEYLAREHIELTRDWYDSLYVFTDIAIDPTFTKEENNFNWPVFSDKVDIIGELETLKVEFQNNTNETVPLFAVTSRINDIFARLRDAHVVPLPSDTADRVLDTFALVLTVGNEPARVNVTADNRGNPRFTRNGRVIARIDGLRPMDWIVRNLATTTVCNSGLFGLKGMGGRVNQILSRAESSGLGNCPLISTGQVSDLRPVQVRYRGGQRLVETWTWGIIDELGTAPTIPKQPITEGVQFRAGEEIIRLTEKLNSEENEEETGRTLEESSKDTSFDPYFKSVNLSCPPLKDYCVFKITAFTIEGLDSLEFQRRLVQDYNKLKEEAAKRNITKLTIDVTQNGGGTIPIGMMMARMLMPNSDAESICQNFQGRFTDTEYFKKMQGWFGPSQGFVGLANESLSTTNWTARLVQLSANDCRLGRELVDDSTQLVEALRAYVAISPTFGASLAILDQVFFTPFLNGLQLFISQCNNGAVNGTETFTPQDLEDLAAFLVENIGGTAAASIIPKQQFQEAVTLNYGGVERLYTAKYRAPDLCFDETIAQEISDLAPFDEMLALSNGFCGSTCGFMSLSAYGYSQTHPEAPRFRFVTFGGTGEPANVQQLSPTAFQGGNVIQSDLATDQWIIFMATSLLHKISQFEFLDDLSLFRDALPITPPLSNTVPNYVVRQSYLDALGPNSLPTEYYIVPSDHYFARWAFDLGIGSSVLGDLYEETANFFNF